MRCTRSKLRKIPCCEPFTPLDEPYFGVPTFFANGHAHGTFYICTYLQTQYDKKQHEKTIPAYSTSNDSMVRWASNVVSGEIFVQIFSRHLCFCNIFCWRLLYPTLMRHFPVLEFAPGERCLSERYFPVLNFAPMGLLIDTDDGQTPKLRLLSFFVCENLLWEIVSDAFGPNWVWRKESFPTFIISERIFLLHIYKEKVFNNTHLIHVHLSGPYQLMYLSKNLTN